ELWLEWSVAGGGSAADITEAERRWDEGKLVADRTGYQAIFTRAQKEGWINPGAERMRLSSVASVEDFSDVSVAEKGDEVAEYLPWPKFTRDKNNKIEGVISNVLLALRRPDLCGVQISLDEFRDEIILTTPKGKNIQLRDEYYTKLHTALESLGFKKFEEAAIKRAVRLIAWENRFDSLKEWVNTLPTWDGVPRIDTFFIRHWGIKESAYTRSVGRYWWTLLAGRALEPGIKGDMAVILVSQQGKNKSEGIRAMAPTPEHYMELDFGKKGEERIREMRGHNVIELGEMRGMDKRGIGDVRVTISTRADRNRGLFREHYVTLPRRCGFIGTSNSETPLTDTEGNRRWLPMTIPDETEGKFIAQGIADEKIQLWAEAVAIFKREGIAWERAETLAKSILGDYEVKDEVWTTSVAEWLEQETVELTGDDIKLNRERVPLTSKDILIDAIGFKATQVKRGDEMRVAKIMKDLGYKKRQLQSLAGKPYHWQKCE
ncbi:VapE domain-containing protein, partial [Candidatus Symbiopectobacterium sp.]|uniref:VapE domain-containing protein n=1 Tax=Candidatus Symbiopectobacterium sp. TaxID=2816440 RepID=UPI0025C3FE3B